MKLTDEEIEKASLEVSSEREHQTSWKVGAKWARDKCCEWIPVSELPKPDRFSIECGSYYRDFIAIQDYDGAIDFATYEKFPDDEKGVFHAFNQTLGEDEVKFCKIIEPPKSE